MLREPGKRHALVTNACITLAACGNASRRGHPPTSRDQIGVILAHRNLHKWVTVRSPNSDARQTFDEKPAGQDDPVHLLIVVRQHGADRAIVHVGLSYRHHIDEHLRLGPMTLQLRDQ
jgi:hypothetical protein